MAINDKLNRIKEIKEDIKQALINKGVEVTDEDSFGSYADKITNIPMEGGDPYYEELYNLRTNNGTDMSGLFARMTGDNLDLTNLDISKCTSMNRMFEWCSVNNVDITGWDLSKVNDVSEMFYYTYLENYKGLSNIILPASLAKMLSSARVKQSKLDLSTWDTSNVTNLNSFYSIDECEILDLSNWNTVNVTNMSSVFSLSYSNKLKELIIPTWDMTNTTSYNNLFGYSSNLNRIKVIDLSKSNDITITKILQSLPARTQTSYSDILVPVDTSQEVIDALIAKYWRPIGPSFNIESFQIISELDELLPGQKTKIICHSQIPWYSSITGVEFISSDDSIATVTDEGEITSHSIGDVEIYARLKNNPEVISNTISINITETDSTPYVIKFKGTSTPDYSNQLSINGNSVQLSNISFDANTGIYTYDVGQEITNIKFNASGSTDYANTITELVKFNFNANNITNMDEMFSYCSRLTNFDFSEWDTSNVISMKNLFKESGFTDLSSVENWNVGNIEDFSGVFWKSNIETIDLSKWTVTNENSVNVGTMFNGCRSLKSVKMFSAKILAGYTFEDCTQLEVVDLTGATSASYASSYSGMFTNVPSTCQIYVGPNWTLTESDCSFTGTFIRVNPEYYTEYSIDSSTATFNMRSIDSINSGAYLPELSNGYDAVLLTLNDGSITTDLNTEANQVSSIKIYYPEETSYVKFANTKVKEVNHLSGSNITDCTGMFTNCIYLEKADLTSLDSTKVTVDTTMFEGVSPEAEVTFNDSWDIPESDMGIGKSEENPYYVEYTIDVADDCTETVGYANTSGTPYLPKINDEIPTNVTIKLKDGTTTNSLDTLAKDVESIKVDYDENTQKIIFGYSANDTNCSKISGINYINFTNKITNMDNMFYICKKLTTLDVSNWDVSNVVSMSSTFSYSSLTTLDVSNWTTTSLTNMNSTFNGCQSLTSLDLSNWDVSNVTSMSKTFYMCKALTSLDLSNWDVSNVTNMTYMFYDCETLSSLKIANNWNTANVTTMKKMFSGCKALTTIDLSNWNTAKVTNLNSLFDGCSALITADLSGWDTSKVDDISYFFRSCKSLLSLNLSNWNTSKVKYNSMNFLGVPAEVDWCYDGTNYANWTLTETQTNYSGTFPWNA